MGKSNEQTIGYKYFLGVHFVPCLGPIDAILKLEVDKRTAWEGNRPAGRILVNKPNLFGGDEREGGVSGYVDFQDGSPTQAANGYLAGLLGASLTTAYRGVVSVILRRCYIGNNPYLKPWGIKLQRVFTGYEGAEQWYTAKAGISRGTKFSDSAIYIAIDGSGSMAGTKFTTAKTSVVALLNLLKANSSTINKNDIRIVYWDDTVADSILRRGAGSSDYDELITWVNALATPVGGTNFSAAVSQAATFFNGTTGDAYGTAGDTYGSEGAIVSASTDGSGNKRRVLLFLTDGLPTPTSTATDAAATLAGIGGLETYGINIELSDTTYTALLDNTAADGVPVISGSDTSALTAALSFAFSLGYDMNPAHILREVLTSPDVGGAGNDYAIGDTFTDAADTLYSEGFGLSFLWRDGTRQEFIDLIERHIDATLYQDRRTGLWELKLIRDDYDADTIPAFTRADIIEWEDVNWPDPAELPNMVTVVYREWRKEEEASVTLANPARIQQVGGLINPRKIEYTGIYLKSLAAKVCARDLAALSAPLMAATVRVRYLSPDINRGDAIKITDAEMGVNGIVCRVVEIEDGDGRNNGVRLRLIEDKFGRATEDLVQVETDDLEEETAVTEPDPRMVVEAPYYAIVSTQGQAAADDILATEPDAGYILTTGGATNDGDVNIKVNVDDGAGYSQAALADFSPAFNLQSNLSKDPTQVKCIVDYSYDLSRIRLGSLAKIGDEFVTINAIEVDGSDSFGSFTGAPSGLVPEYWEPPSMPVGAISLLTLGRGCLDTVPQEHFPGDKIIAWQDFAGALETQYLATETPDVKLLSYGPNGTVEIDDATAETVTMDSRAIRPYPAANVKADGEYEPTGEFTGTITLTWNHRNRLLQTTSVFDDWTRASITPEAGTEYIIRAWEIDGAGDIVGSPVIETNEGLVDTYMLDASASGIDSSAWAGARVSVVALRDGYESWQSAELDFLFGTTMPAPGVADLTSLFDGGVVGVWYDFSDASTMFTDTAGTTPVSAYGDRVARINDKSGNGNYASHGSAGPIYSRMPKGGVRTLVSYSEDFSNAYWANDNASYTLAADGVANLTYPTASGGSSAMYFFADTPASRAMTFSAEFKAAGKNAAYIQINDNGSLKAAYVAIDLTDGTTGTFTNLAGTLGGKSVSVTDMGGGYYRLEAHFTTDSSNSSPPAYYVGACDSKSSRSITKSGTDGVYVRNIQLEAGSTATAYQKANTRYDITEAGVENIDCVFLSSSKLVTSAAPLSTSVDNISVAWAGQNIQDALCCVVQTTQTSSPAFAGWDASSGTGAWGLFCRGSDAGYFFGVKGTAGGNIYANAPAGTYNDPRILIATGDISNDNLEIFEQGTGGGANTADRGTGNWNTYPAYLFHTPTTAGTAFVQGWCVGIAILPGVADTTDQAQITDYFNSLYGAY